MCGIVGLLIKKPALRNQLGPWVAPMLECLEGRGPDSAGLAVFVEPTANGARRFSLYDCVGTTNWNELRADCSQQFGGCRLDAHGRRALLTIDVETALFELWLSRTFPGLHVLAVGMSIEVFKDTGSPTEISRRFAFDRLQGSHAVGHTRMATESAVSPLHAHPFTAGEDFCLVHNGSLSNPHSVRRSLSRRGISFETDNDTEAACRFLEWRLSQGDSLEDAIAKAFEVLDGFYTLLMATRSQIMLVRDPFACKPAMVAETNDYIAVASEYRALAHLPGVSGARLFEPAPERIYAWSV